ncbi:expressed protein [Echinococcus multilocularis]|uniref:Expressed protein n=1 Tax=Echinococcus multilocularis TaxID=6211 RepID=A0A087VWM3_ECHMU|nr:expressed protein [Echinococcus multilocularis]
MVAVLPPVGVALLVSPAAAAAGAAAASLVVHSCPASVILLFAVVGARPGGSGRVARSLPLSGRGHVESGGY